MKRLIIFVLIFVAYFCLQSLVAHGDEIKTIILEYGIFEKTDKIIEVDAPNTAEGSISAIVHNVKLKETTDIIPAKIGVTFGVHYLIKNVYDSVELRTVVVNPPLKKEKHSKPVTIQEDYRTRTPDNGKIVDFIGMEFHEEYELVPGNWIFQVYLGNKMIMTKKFVVVK